MHANIYWTIQTEFQINSLKIKSVSPWIRTTWPSQKVDTVAVTCKDTSTNIGDVGGAIAGFTLKWWKRTNTRACTRGHKRHILNPRSIWVSLKCSCVCLSSTHGKHIRDWEKESSLLNMSAAVRTRRPLCLSHKYTLFVLESIPTRI